MIDVNDTATRQRVVLVSGLSGAGKFTMLRALEDLGYEAVDNPPLEFIEELVSGADGPRSVAVGVDARSRGFDAASVLATLARLRLNPGLRPELLYAWADETVLQRRYTETRRRHPLSPRGRVADGIAAEQQLTAPLHAAADFVIDTSALPVAGLRQLIEQRYGMDTAGGAQAGLALSLVSFAFPAGLPREADIVLDVRFLRNPHYVAELRNGTGHDQAVAEYVQADPDFAAFFTKMTDLLDLVLPRFVQEGKKYATVAVGCTGGRHRSVTVVRRLESYLTQAGWRVSSTHRELLREDILRPLASNGGRADSTGSGDPPVQAQEA
jgi:UPF0042 nucleotide-binding protein